MRQHIGSTLAGIWSIAAIFLSGELSRYHKFPAPKPGGNAYINFGV